MIISVYSHDSFSRASAERKAQEWAAKAASYDRLFNKRGNRTKIMTAEQVARLYAVAAASADSPRGGERWATAEAAARKAAE